MVQFFKIKIQYVNLYSPAGWIIHVYALSICQHLSLITYFCVWINEIATVRMTNIK